MAKSSQILKLTSISYANGGLEGVSIDGGPWRIIQGVMWRPDMNRLSRFVHVCCLLHNIVIDLEDKVKDEIPL
ncbi:hypothetical protein LguiB_029551 [Lonicera macranthoides]